MGCARTIADWGLCLFEYISKLLYLLLYPSSHPILMISSVRLIFSSSKSFNPSLSEQELHDGCRLGLDSHADVSCVGKHAHILETFTGRTCNVQPFNDSYKPMRGIKTVNAAFAYDHDDGITYILTVNQALDFSQSMIHSLLCPNQARVNGVVINDVPKFLDRTGNSTHSIQIPERSLDFPLHLKGPISYLLVRFPTQLELDECEYVDLTDHEMEWDPSSLDGKSKLVHSTQVEWGDTYDPHPIDGELMENDLYECLIGEIMVHGVTHQKLNEIGPESLASLWNIPLKYAKLTLDSTTQNAITRKDGMLSRRYKPQVHHTRYRQLGGYLGMFASDTFKSNVISTRGNRYIQLFCNRGNYSKSYPIKSKSHAHHALDTLIHEVGVPNELLTDGAKELTTGQWAKTCRRRGIHMATTEPHSPWQNHAERIGGIVKRRVKYLMRRTHTPVRLWDYCWEYASGILALTTTDSVKLNNVTPFENIFNYTPDIAEYILFGWFQWVWYHDPSSPDEVLLGRWLGPSVATGQPLASYILNSNGKVVTRSTVSSLSPSELVSNDIRRKQEEFTESMEAVIGNHAKAINNHITSDYDHQNPFDSIFEDDVMDDEDIEPVDPRHAKSDLDELLAPHDSAVAESTDEHIGLTVDLPLDGELRQGKVVSRKRNHDGTLVGTPHENPTLDSRVYTVDFGDGEYADYSTNVLMENLYAQVDEDGYQFNIFDGIVAHKKLDTALSPENGHYVNKYGVRKRVITTKGWKIKIQWKNGTSSWVPLSDIKESHPIELAEYAVSRNIHEEPAFAWWVNHVLKKRDRIVKQVRHRMLKRTSKFGVKVPSSVEEALKFDQENGDNLWFEAINKEIKNVKVAFHLLGEDESPPPGSKQIPYHIIFDVRFDLTRKARLVAGGHRNKGVPQHSRFSSVASRDSIRLGFLIAALNDLSVATTDIGNAYLNAPPKEQVHVTVGPELFGQDKAGRTAIIVRALYGLKSAGNAWREYFATFIMSELDFDPTTADPDVYRRPEVDNDGKEYYAYLIIYVDDVLCIHHDPKQVMDVIGETFRLKNGIDTNPSNYLGADIRSWTYERQDGTEGQCWAIGSQSYLKEALRICEARMQEHGLSYSSSRRKGKDTPFRTQDYRPELDATDFCDKALANLYQQLIGILRWVCELGRMDILHEVSLLSQYLAQPRIGHLQEAINIFFYLKHHSRSWVVLDPSTFEVDWQPKENEPSPDERALALKAIYPDASDELPHNMPPPRGNPVNISIFVDADHAGNRVTRRSHTGIVIYCNLAPIIWYSRRQNTVETSTFGSEFIALKIATELNDSLIYKLRMFGVPVAGPSRVMCDNEAVVKSSSFAESTLKKKHCSIAFHRVRESVASGRLLIYYEHTSSNLADLFTKVLSASKRVPLIQGLLS